MTPDQSKLLEQNHRTQQEIAHAVTIARHKLLLNTHDNTVREDETSKDYIKRKWHGYCVQAGIIAAHDLAKNHSSEFSHILLLSSHGEEGDYSGAFGDPEYIGHLVCICRNNEGDWVSISPTTYSEDNPEDTADSIHLENSLSAILSYLGTAFGGQWPSEAEIFANYQQPAIHEDTNSETDGSLALKDTIHLLQATWVQKEPSTTLTSYKSLPVSREIENSGTMPREYLYKNDFFTPQE